MKLLKQGAESTLFLDKKNVIKSRFKKGYRIREIDEKLQSSRTRREVKILEKLAAIDFAAPRLKETNEKDSITMQHIPGKLIKDILNKRTNKKIGKEIGEKVAILHNNQIIHGDLTTSNMIRDKEIYFIDFGLSFISLKAEDKAVDLHLLKEALESKHYDCWQQAYAAVLDAYKRKARDSAQTLERLSEVEKRGRYKHKQ